jgi:hypothetical protein
MPSHKEFYWLFEADSVACESRPSKYLKCQWKQILVERCCKDISSKPLQEVSVACPRHANLNVSFLAPVLRTESRVTRTEQLVIEEHRNTRFWCQLITTVSCIAVLTTHYLLSSNFQAAERIRLWSISFCLDLRATNTLCNTHNAIFWFSENFVLRNSLQDVGLPFMLSSSPVPWHTCLFLYVTLMFTTYNLKNLKFI